MERFVNVKRGSIIDLSTSIVIETPVDKGYLINNWMPSVDSPKYQPKIKDPSPQGADSIKRLSSTAKQVNFKNVFYLTNSMPYAYPIEYFSHSGKAPRGMVRVNLARWDNIVSANLEKFK